MTLSKQREKLVEEFETSRFVYWDISGDGVGVLQGTFPDFKDWLTQALNDYTESIVRMVDKYIEGTKKSKLTMSSYGDEYIAGYNQYVKASEMAFKNLKRELLEELSK